MGEIKGLQGKQLKRGVSENNLPRLQYAHSKLPVNVSASAVFAETGFGGFISAAITRVRASGQSGWYSVGDFSHSSVETWPPVRTRTGPFPV